MTKYLKNKKIMIPVCVVIVLLLLALAARMYYRNSLRPVSQKDAPILFHVASGEEPSMVLANLKEKKLIRSTSMTKLYMRLHKLDDIKAGNFTLNQSYDSEKIVAILNDTKYAQDDQVEITFKEGMWAKDVAALIQKKMGIPKEKLLALWNDDDYIKGLMKKYPFITNDVLNPQYKVKLEGYLFPETYSFKRNASAQEVTETFLDHFASIYNKYKADIKKSGYSVQQIVTLASMVQYEAAHKSDMAMIAGVFYNRLQRGMKLESSVTVCYALYDEMKSADDCEINTDVDSPYNTYLHPGLPIGPILNPGEDAIHAVLFPTKSDYLYFVADIYGDGSVHYATTLDQQEANIDKYHLRK